MLSYMMVEKKHLKLGLALPFAILLTAGIGAVIYAILPISLTSGVTLLSAGVALLITVGLLFVVVPLTLTTIDVLQSKEMTTRKKLKWLFILWIMPGSIFAAIYYFFKKRE